MKIGEKKKIKFCTKISQYYLIFLFVTSLNKSDQKTNVKQVNYAISILTYTATCIDGYIYPQVE